MVCKSVSPVLSVRHVTSALEHYKKLGFETQAYGQDVDDHGPVYGFMSLGEVELHVARVPTLDPSKNMSACYLYVDDANAFHKSWTESGASGRFTTPEDTPYALREFAHIDPDGNLIRVGSPLAK